MCVSVYLLISVKLMFYFRIIIDFFSNFEKLALTHLIKFLIADCTNVILRNLDMTGFLNYLRKKNCLTKTPMYFIKF